MWSLARHGLGRASLTLEGWGSYHDGMGEGLYTLGLRESSRVLQALLSQCVRPMSPESTQ